jgi:hypothetical protein
MERGAFDYWISLTGPNAAESPKQSVYDFIGFPVDPPTVGEKGTFFSNGVIFNPSDVVALGTSYYAVTGSIYAKWSTDRPVLGNPTGLAASVSAPGTTIAWAGQTFEHGEIWTETKATTVPKTFSLHSGPVLAHCRSNPECGDPAGDTGYSVTTGYNGVGTSFVQMGNYQHGNVYATYARTTATPEAGADPSRAVLIPNQPADAAGNSLASEYQKHGGPTGWLGLPMSTGVSTWSHPTSGARHHWAQFKSGLLVSYADDLIGPPGPDQYGRGRPTAFGELVYNLDGSTCLQGADVSICEPFGCHSIGPFWHVNMRVDEDGQGNVTTHRYPDGDDNFEGGDRKGTHTAVNLGFARPDRAWTVTLEGVSSHHNTYSTTVLHYNLENRWGTTAPVATNNPPMVFETHVDTEQHYDLNDWHGQRWWSFHNFANATGGSHLSWRTFQSTFEDLANMDQCYFYMPSCWLYNALYNDNVAANGNCFGMSIMSVEAQLGRVAWSNPIHRYFGDTQNGARLNDWDNHNKVRLNQVLQDPAHVTLIDAINARQGRNLGLEMISFILGDRLRLQGKAPKTVFEDTVKLLKEGAHPLWSIHSDQVGGHPHVIRPYAKDVNDLIGPAWGDTWEHCRWVANGTDTCRHLRVLDPNLPSALSAAADDRVIEFSQDNWFGYDPRDNNNDPIYRDDGKLRYGGNFWGGGRITILPEHVYLHKATNPVSLGMGLLALATPVAGAVSVPAFAASLTFFGSDTEVTQVSDPSGKVLFANASDGTRMLADETNRIPDVGVVPLPGDTAGSGAFLLGSFDASPTRTYSLRGKSTGYDAMVLTQLLTTTVHADASDAIPDSLTMIQPTSLDKAVSFKVAANGVAKHIDWTWAGPNRGRPLTMKGVSFVPGQEITWQVERGLSQVTFKNDGPATEGELVMTRPDGSTLSAGTVKIPSGKNSVLCQPGASKLACTRAPVDLQSIFGFESPAAWNTGSTASEVVGTPHTEGNFALRLGGSGFREISSRMFDTSLYDGVSSTLALDVYVPARPSNPYWQGAVQLYASCPSANLNHAWVGQVELTGKPTGAFATLSFPLPPDVVAAMSSAHADFSVSIAVNADPAGEDIVLDNLRFIGAKQPPRTTPVMRPTSQRDLFGFENGDNWSYKGAPYTMTEIPVTEGKTSLAIASGSYQSITSQPCDTSLLLDVGATMLLDVYLPSAPSNPNWLGAVQMYVSIPSANLNNAWIGQNDLTGLASGRFTTLQFTLPAAVVAALKEDHADVSFSFAVNGPSSAEAFHLDNLRFVSP